MVDTPMSPPLEEKGPRNGFYPNYADYSEPQQSLDMTTNHFQSMELIVNGPLAKKQYRIIWTRQLLREKRPYKSKRTEKPS